LRLLKFEKSGTGVASENHAQDARATIKYDAARAVDLIG
jgi:hypothetical protein